MKALGIKGGSPNWWNIIKAFFIVLIIFIAICMILSSCSVELQDQRALSRVEAKDNLINAAAEQWQKNHPARIDTQKVYLPGKPIPYPVEKTVADLQAIKKAIDSTKAAIKIPKCDSAIEVAYNNGYNDALADHPPTQQVDTAKYTLKDSRALDAANDTINKLRIQIAGMNGQINDAHAATESEHKRGNKFLYYLIAVLSIIGLGAGWKIYTSFKPSVKL